MPTYMLFIREANELWQTSPQLSDAAAGRRQNSWGRDLFRHCAKKYDAPRRQ